MCRKINKSHSNKVLYFWEFKHAHIQLTAKQNNLERLHLHITAIIYRLSNFGILGPGHAPSPGRTGLGKTGGKMKWVFGNCQKLPSPLSSSFSASIFQGTLLVYRASLMYQPSQSYGKIFILKNPNHIHYVSIHRSPSTYKRVTSLMRLVNWKYSRLKIYLNT